MIKTNKNQKFQALSQIFILMIAIFAFAYLVGSSVPVVSASEEKVGDICDENYERTCGTETEVFYCAQNKIVSNNCALSNNVCSGGICIPKATTPPLEGNTNIPVDNQGGFFKKALGYATPYAVPEAIKLVRGGGSKGLEGSLAEGSKVILEGGEEIAKVFSDFSPAGQIFRTAAWAAGLYFGIRLLGTVVTDDSNIQRGFNQAATAAAIGYSTGNLLLALGVFGDKLGLIGFLGATGAGLIFAGAAIIIGVLLFKNERYQPVAFGCQAWQAPKGGDDCEACNEQGLLSCSEYQCKSLGQGCEIINKGTTQEKCTNALCRNDIAYPTITTWDDALINNKFVYAPTTVLAPGDKGVYVRYKDSSDGCVPAYTPLSFGVTLNEPSSCKISPIRADTYEGMGNLYLSGGLSDYNHSFTLSLPGSSALSSENITIENGGEYELHIRCEDVCGYSNPANFVFKYCVDDSPDTTAPLIVFADPLNGLPVSYNVGSVLSNIYVNEPAECKWSRLDQSYESMEEEMTCASSVLEMNAQMLYPCSANLTGIQNEVENKFYIRCKDQPALEGTENEGQRNTNSQSYAYSLLGTRALVLSSAEPNDTKISGAATPMKVTLEATTSAGYNDGEAICSYSTTGNAGSYIEFFNTDSYQHSQDLWLGEGNYEYFIRCVDLGGNSDSEIINFEVEADTFPPSIVRVYHEENFLKIITDEEAECVYDTRECNYNFEEGISIVSLNDGLEHYVDWNSKTNFYIKCGDVIEGILTNKPLPDKCSIIVKPFNVPSF